jgi:hypothetical protein
VVRRERALKTFKKKDSELRVLLLNLENTASGANLIVASHIILMGISFFFFPIFIFPFLKVIVLRYSHGYLF